MADVTGIEQTQELLYQQSVQAARQHVVAHALQVLDPTREQMALTYPQLIEALRIVCDEELRRLGQETA